MINLSPNQARMHARTSAIGPRPHASRAMPVCCLKGRQRLVVSAGVLAPGDTVLVVGATGGVGQLVTAKLLEKGYKVRALTRNKAKAAQLFGNGFSGKLQLVEGDCRNAGGLSSATNGVDAIACCTGTTAFPSSRWAGDNGPRPTDLVGNQNLIAATPKSIKRFVLVTSAGVERQKQLPWVILNLFGVLGFKREAEKLLEASGLPYTIFRPSRLTDGPYTSFDLNTLLKSTSGSRQDVTLASTDSLFGEASRIALAEAVVQSLASEAAEGRKFALSSAEGEGPGSDTDKWGRLFASAQ